MMVTPGNTGRNGFIIIGPSIFFFGNSDQGREGRDKHHAPTVMMVRGQVSRFAQPVINREEMAPRGHKWTIFFVVETVESSTEVARRP